MSAVAIISVGGGIAAALGMDPRDGGIIRPGRHAQPGVRHQWMSSTMCSGRALGLSIAQLRRLVAVTGIDPFHQALAQTGVVSQRQGRCLFIRFPALAAKPSSARWPAFDFTLALLDEAAG